MKTTIWDRKLREHTYDHQLQSNKQIKLFNCTTYYKFNHNFKWETLDVLDQTKTNNARICLKSWYCDKSAIYRLTEISSTPTTIQERKQSKVKERGKHILPHLMPIDHSSFPHKQKVARINKNKQK